MGILDIVIIVLAVVFIVFGFIKGFVKQVIKALSGIISFVLSTILCKKVGAILLKSFIGEKFINYFYDYLSKKSDLFTNSGVELTEEVITNGLKEAGIPSFLHKLIIGSMDLSKIPSDVTLGEYLSSVLTNGILVVLSFIVIYLIVFLIVKIIAKIVSGAVRGSALGLIDGFLGSAWCIIKVGFIVSCLFLVLSFVVTLPFGEGINTWITNDMKLNEEGFGIAKYLYQNNPILLIFDKLNISSSIDGLFNSTESSILIIDNFSYLIKK